MTMVDGLEMLLSQIEVDLVNFEHGDELAGTVAKRIVAATARLAIARANSADLPLNRGYNGSEIVGANLMQRAVVARLEAIMAALAEG